MIAPASSIGSKIEVVKLRPQHLSSALWARYKYLHNQDTSSAHPMLDPYFAEIIAQVRDDVRIILCYLDGEPVAFWPVHERPGAWARPLGGPFSDLHGPVLHADVSIPEDFLLARAGFSGMTVSGLRPSEICATEMTGMRTQSHVAILEEGIENYLDTQEFFNPKFVKKLKRRRRKMEKNFSEVTFTLDDKSDLAFNWLLETKRRQYVSTAKHDVLSPEWVQNFLSISKSYPGDDWRLQLSTLILDGEIAAAELNMCSNAVIHGWLVAYNTKFANFSPGLVILQEILEAMTRHGFTQYELGIADADYKNYFSNHIKPIEYGTINVNRRSLNPYRLSAGLWQSAEQICPTHVSNTLQKIRRRTDQICSAEIRLSNRIRGFTKAAFEF